ncbi:MAG: gliding motility protein GldC [Ginsengibacter sp.]
MTSSTIKIDVELDAEKVPQQISWSAAGSSAHDPQKAKAMLLAFWDTVDKSAMRIDLWTKGMMVDEMADFYYQVFITMADTFKRATNNDVLVSDIKSFAVDFHKKFVEMEKGRSK